MKKSGILFSALVLAFSLAAHAEPSWKKIDEVRENVIALAFDPGKFFPDGDLGDSSMIRIAYTGDDYGWPVYSIAIAKGCLEKEAWSKDCASRVTARMVRAPAPPEMTRPRGRGSYLVGQLVEKRFYSQAAIRSKLGSLGVEWLEADLSACPEANAILSDTDDLVWPTRQINMVTAKGEIVVVLHADKVEVVFDHYAQRSTYWGYIADGSPAQWADRLASALEHCWRPSEAAAPWTR